MKRIVLILFVFAGAGLFWLLSGWKTIPYGDNDHKINEMNSNSAECRYPWEKLRILQHVLRPGTTAADQQSYTVIYYEQQYEEGSRDRFIALYRGKKSVFATCANKFDQRYGSPNKLDLRYPPIAMTIFEGDFILQTTDDPKRGVPLDKLPLVFGPKEPIVTRAKK